VHGLSGVWAYGLQTCISSVWEETGPRLRIYGSDGGDYDIYILLACDRIQPQERFTDVSDGISASVFTVEYWKQSREYLTHMRILNFALCFTKMRT
jgi:hypothetical protein